MTLTFSLCAYCEISDTSKISSVAIAPDVEQFCKIVDNVAAALENGSDNLHTADKLFDRQLSGISDILNLDKILTGEEKEKIKQSFNVLVLRLIKAAMSLSGVEYSALDETTKTDVDAKIHYIFEEMNREIETCRTLSELGKAAKNAFGIVD